MLNIRRKSVLLTSWLSVNIIFLCGLLTTAILLFNSACYKSYGQNGFKSSNGPTLYLAKKANTT